METSLRFVELQMAVRMTVSALEALQQAAEDFLVKVLEDANLLAIHAKATGYYHGEGY